MVLCKSKANQIAVNNLNINQHKEWYNSSCKANQIQDQMGEAKYIDQHNYYANRKMKEAI